MNLIVDKGNTCLKLAVVDNGKIVDEMTTYDVPDAVGWLEAVVFIYKMDKAILSSVTDYDRDIMRFFKKYMPRFKFMDTRMSLPITVEYETKETLGVDRIAAAVGAYSEKEGENLIVIDAGTAITYEVIEASGKYVGGNISPGMITRFRALNTFTKRLPLVQKQDDAPLTGTNTQTAILSGVINGIVFEMDGFIDAYRAKYGDIFVFLTGGDAFFFEKRLKNRTFADANLVIKGLNRILEYNDKVN
ncbi:MAG: type III pantothenate kinase [Tannerella sp.]|nr:type III pantothenate kinase [Tannerella sp.]